MGERATTWEEWRDGTGNFCQCLVELRLRELVTGSWTSGGGGAPNTYYVTVTQRLNQHNRRVPTAAQADGSTLTERGSLADCNSNAGSWYWDNTNSRLYVRLNPTADPTSVHAVTWDFWLYFSKGPEVDGEVSYNGQDYRPHLLAISELTREAQELYEGLPVGGTGTITLANPQVHGADGESAAGIWDNLLELYQWVGAQARILIGGDDLPYSEFECIWTGKITRPEWGEDAITIGIEDVGGALDGLPSQTTITLAGYPSAHEDAVGRVLPLIYGAVRDVTAWCINTDSLLFAFCEHECDQLERIEIEGVGEVIPYSITLASGQFTLPEHLRTYIIDDRRRVSVDVVGKPDGSGDPMTNPADVLKDVLNNRFNLATNAASFSAARTLTAAFHVAYAVTEPPESGRQMVELLCKTGLAYLTQNAAGEYVMDVPTPMRSDSSVVRTLTDVSGAVGAIKVEWDADRAAGGYTIEAAPESSVRDFDGEQSQAQTYTLDDTTGTQITQSDRIVSVQTLLENVDMGSLLAGRLALFYRAAPWRATIEINRQWSDLAINSKIAVTKRRAPDSGGTGWSARKVRLLSLSFNPVTCTGTALIEDVVIPQVRGYGVWKAGGTPNWAAASGAQRAAGGWWTDANGKADAADATSVNYSLWS